MVISFLGWAAETVFFWFCYGKVYDRGFMTLPFCTIYGASFLLVYFLAGTLGEGGVLLRKRGYSLSRTVGCFFLSMVLPTALELVTGLFFHRFFDMRLWSYAAYRFHYGGYICLEYAFLWGALVPVCMEWVFLPLRRWVFGLESRQVAAAAGAAAVLAAVDWGVNFARL